MSRTNLDGKPIKRVRLLNRNLKDADLASALGMPASNYSRHKHDDDYPNFAELEQLGAAFGLSARPLQIGFGWRGLDELVLLDGDEMRQWIEQGRGNHKGRPGRPLSLPSGAARDGV